MRSNIIFSGLGSFFIAVLLFTPYWFVDQPFRSYEEGGSLVDIAVAEASEWPSAELSGSTVPITAPMEVNPDTSAVQWTDSMMEPTPLLFLCTGLIWLACVRPLCKNWSAYRKDRILRRQVQESHEYQVSRQIFKKQPSITMTLMTWK